jgi:hypothetical protein
MVVPKLAKHSATYASITADGIVPSMVDDDGDFVMGSLTTNSVKGTDDIIVKQAANKEFQVETDGGLSAITVDKDGKCLIPKLQATEVASAGIALANLTAAIGDPAGLADGQVFYVHNTGDSNKLYMVVVRNHTFHISAALTAVSA